MIDDNLLDEFLDATYRTKYTEQGSDAWEQLRVGRFTSSEFYKLMECGFRPMTEKELAARPKSGKGSKTTRVPDPKTMGKAGITYIRQKVWETLTGQIKASSYAYPIVYGKEMEDEAVEHFEKTYGLETTRVGFQPWTDHSGGSPDRLIGEDEGLEIKCPYSDEQIDYLMLTDHYDLKANYPAYYWQCATLLLFTNRQRWHFCTYDPRMQDESLRMTHIIIERGKIQEDLDLIPVVLASAVEEKLRLIQTVSGNGK